MGAVLFPYSTLFRAPAPRRDMMASLAVDALVEGSVFVAGDSVLVQISLSDASSLLFTREYQRDMGDVLQVITEISQRSEEHTSELQSRENLVCRLLL